MTYHRKLNHSNTKREAMYKIFQAAGVFLILLSVLALMNDTFRIMPYYVKAVILYLSAFFILFLSNFQKGDKK